jgi:serine/threonine protein kinase
VIAARDTRPDRIVAIKVLPTHLADRSQLRERFEREAKTIATLNHSHICVLHDIGHQDGIDFLVIEYLEGETLAQRLVKGPLPIQQVLRYAIELASTLDKAHRKGITHRDLKPGNIMLTKSGTKLLDFGLAKLKQEVARSNWVAVSIAALALHNPGSPQVSRFLLRPHAWRQQFGAWRCRGTLRSASGEVSGVSSGVDWVVLALGLGIFARWQRCGEPAFRR